MIIVITESANKWGDGREEMSINGKYRLTVSDLSETPEDAIIGRSLVSCSEIADFMREAYEAGKLGEDFSVEVVQEPAEEE